jgi:hypothetical protein
MMMTTTAMRSLPRLVRLLAVGAWVALPTFAHAAASSSITFGDRETYALLAAGLGMVVFMAARRGNR